MKQKSGPGEAPAGKMLTADVSGNFLIFWLPVRDHRPPLLVYAFAEAASSKKK